MKKIIFLLISLMLIAQITSAAILPSTQRIQIVAEEVTPEPVEPGQDLTVKIRIYNAGGETAKNVVIKRDYAFPFKLKSVNQDSISFNDIAAGGSRDETFYLTISPKAKSGTYPLKFIVETEHSSGSKTIESQEILVNVVGKPEIIIETSKMDDEISANSEFNVELNVRNIGSGNARNIKIVSDYEGIAPVGSNIVYLEGLQAGNNSVVTVPFKISESIDPGFYSIPLNVDFLSESGEKTSVIQEIGVSIIHKADVSMQNLQVKPGTISVGGKISIEARVENVGEGDADNVYVELKLSPSEGIAGSKKAYIGQLKKGDDAPAIFSLTGQSANKYSGELIIHYSDDLGEHTKTEKIGLSVKESTNYLYYAIGLILIAGVGYFVFYKKKRK